MTLLQMSIIAAAFIVVIVFIRLIAIHKLAKNTFVILWCVVLVRLLIPFSIPLPVEIFANRTTESEASSETVYAIPTAVDTILRAQNIGGINNGAHTQQADDVSPVGAATVVTAIWVAGMVSFALFFFIPHFRRRIEYKAALPFENKFANEYLQKHKIWRRIQIKQSDKINTPMTYGILKPIVLLPKNINLQEKPYLEYVLSHELAHIKRFDILIKWLLAAATCVHWFNPAVWAMYILANRDIEIACDETVVRSLGEASKYSYALSLVELEEEKGVFSPMFNNFAKLAIKERIHAIMKLKQNSFTGIILSCMLVLTLAACSFLALENNAAEYSPVYIENEIAAEENIYGEFAPSYYEEEYLPQATRVEETEREVYGEITIDATNDLIPVEISSPYKIAENLEEVRAILALQDGSIPVTNVEVPEIISGQENGIIVREQCLHEALDVLNRAYTQDGNVIKNAATIRIDIQPPMEELPRQMQEALVRGQIFLEANIIGFDTNNLSNEMHDAINLEVQTLLIRHADGEWSSGEHIQEVVLRLFGGQ